MCWKDVSMEFGMDYMCYESSIDYRHRPKSDDVRNLLALFCATARSDYWRVTFRNHIYKWLAAVVELIYRAHFICISFGVGKGTESPFT